MKTGRIAATGRSDTIALNACLILNFRREIRVKSMRRNKKRGASILSWRPAWKRFLRPVSGTCVSCWACAHSLREPISPRSSEGLHGQLAETVLRADAVEVKKKFQRDSIEINDRPEKLIQNEKKE
jgi:hypothetical protein